MRTANKPVEGANKRSESANKSGSANKNRESAIKISETAIKFLRILNLIVYCLYRLGVYSVFHRNNWSKVAINKRKMLSLLYF
ncbi:hypothetical protein CN692_07355 [Bacillus sp. AFS002410]|nr:hypothetical protein CN692_07355 [Bacillus sp. AFS002410]